MNFLIKFAINDCSFKSNNIMSNTIMLEVIIIYYVLLAYKRLKVIVHSMLLWCLMLDRLYNINLIKVC